MIAVASLIFETFINGLKCKLLTIGGITSLSSLVPTAFIPSPIHYFTTCIYFMCCLDHSSRYSLNNTLRIMCFPSDFLIRRLQQIILLILPSHRTIFILTLHLLSNTQIILPVTIQSEKVCFCVETLIWYRLGIFLISSSCFSCVGLDVEFLEVGVTPGRGVEGTQSCMDAWVSSAHFY